MVFLLVVTLQGAMFVLRQNGLFTSSVAPLMLNWMPHVINAIYSTSLEQGPQNGTFYYCFSRGTTELLEGKIKKV